MERANLLAWIGSLVGGTSVEATFANVYPSLLNTMIVSLMAIIGITGLKFLSAKFDIIPGFRDLVASI